ncbi:MAG: DUF542 domain-containing protein [Pirellulaceae bacterium]
MSPLTIDCPVVDWIIAYPHAIRILERLQIDYHCGGKSLGYACRERDISPEQVVAEITGE